MAFRGDPETDTARGHPSDILDYFRDKAEVLATGEMGLLEQNYLDKHAAVNHTARALTENGLGFESRSYWMAGRNVLDGQPIYWAVTIDAYGAYRIPRSSPTSSRRSHGSCASRS